MSALTELVGRSVSETRVVDGADLASVWGNDIPVLATPVLLWWAELTAMAVIEPQLEPTTMSVGAAHRVRHRAASVERSCVEMTATLRLVTGCICTFDVVALDGARVVFEGQHDRGVVSRAAFLAQLSHITPSPSPVPSPGGHPAWKS